MAEVRFVVPMVLEKVCSDGTSEPFETPKRRTSIDKVVFCDAEETHADIILPDGGVLRGVDISTFECKNCAPIKVDAKPEEKKASPQPQPQTLQKQTPLKDWVFGEGKDS
jgi:hypothetical protein